MLIELAIVCAILVAILFAGRRLRVERSPEAVLAVLVFTGLAFVALKVQGIWPTTIRVLGGLTIVGWGWRLGWRRPRAPKSAVIGLVIGTWVVMSIAVALAIPRDVTLGRGGGWVLTATVISFLVAMGTLRFERTRGPVWGLALGMMTATLAGMAAIGIGEAAWDLGRNFGRNGWEIYDAGWGATPDSTGHSTWRGLFGRRREFAVPITLNVLGFRDRDHSVIPAPGTLRFAVVGDSFVEALQVPLHETVTTQLESLLRERSILPVEGLAFGRSGHGLGSHRDLLDPTVMAFEPRLVIVCFLPGNDLRDESSVLTVRQQQLNGFRLNRTAVGRLARARRLQLTGAALLSLDRALASRRQRGFPFDDRVYREPPLDENWAVAWTGAEAAVQDLQRLWTGGAAHGVLVIIPSRFELEAAVDCSSMNAELARRAARAGLPPDGWDYRAPAQRMRRVAEDLGVPVLDLAAVWAMLPPQDREGLYWRDDGHWTAKGHRLAAATLDRFLAERPELLRPPEPEAAQ